MSKEDFTFFLRKRLVLLPQEDTEDRIAFYTEMIDHRMGNGMSEEEAVASLGPIEDIAEHIMSEIPLSTLVMRQVKPKHSTKGLQIALIILGFPLWFPLIITAFVLIVTFYLTAWIIQAAFYIVVLSLAIAAAATIPFAIYLFIHSNIPGGLFAIGAGLIVFGVALILFALCNGVTRLLIKLTGKILYRIKSLFVGKEVSKNA